MGKGTKQIRMGRIYKVLDWCYLFEQVCRKQVEKAKEQGNRQMADIAKYQAEGVRWAINIIKEELDIGDRDWDSNFH